MRIIFYNFFLAKFEVAIAASNNIVFRLSNIIEVNINLKGKNTYWILKNSFGKLNIQLQMIFPCLVVQKGFSCDSAGKESTCNEGDLSSTPC